MRIDTCRVQVERPEAVDWAMREECENAVADQCSKNQEVSCSLRKFVSFEIKTKKLLWVRWVCFACYAILLVELVEYKQDRKHARGCQQRKRAQKVVVRLVALAEALADELDLPGTKCDVWLHELRRHRCLAREWTIRHNDPQNDRAVQQDAGSHQRMPHVYKAPLINSLGVYYCSEA